MKLIPYYIQGIIVWYKDTIFVLADIILEVVFGTISALGVVVGFVAAVIKYIKYWRKKHKKGSTICFSKQYHGNFNNLLVPADTSCYANLKNALN